MRRRSLGFAWAMFTIFDLTFSRFVSILASQNQPSSYRNPVGEECDAAIRPAAVY